MRKKKKKDPTLEKEEGFQFQTSVERSLNCTAYSRAAIACHVTMQPDTTVSVSEYICASHFKTTKCVFLPVLIIKQNCFDTDGLR